MRKTNARSRAATLLRLLIGLGSIAWLSACVVAAGLPQEAHEYVDPFTLPTAVKINEHRYIIEIKGVSNVSVKRLRQIALLKAATHSQEKGYRYTYPINDRLTETVVRVCRGCTRQRTNAVTVNLWFAIGNSEAELRTEVSDFNPRRIHENTRVIPKLKADIAKPDCGPDHLMASGLPAPCS